MTLDLNPLQEETEKPIQGTLFGWLPNNIGESFKAVCDGVKGLFSSNSSEHTNDFGRATSFTPLSTISFVPALPSPLAQTNQGVEQINIHPAIIALFSNPEAAKQVEDIRISFQNGREGLGLYCSDVREIDVLSRVSPTAGLPNMTYGRAQSAVGGFGFNS